MLCAVNFVLALEVAATVRGADHGRAPKTGLRPVLIGDWNGGILMRITPQQIAVAGICGGLALALSYTPLGFISVPNISGAATTLHIPAIVAGVVAGPLAGALVGLVLAIRSWWQFGGVFMQFAGGNLIIALAGAFLPRVLIGVAAYYAYRALRGTGASILAAILGTTTNTAGVLGILWFLGTPDFRTAVAPVIAVNYPFEVLFAAVVAVPVFAVLSRNRPLAAARS